MMAKERSLAKLEQKRADFDRELIRFIDYGVLLDRRTRRYLAEIIRHKVLAESVPELPPLLLQDSATEAELDVSYTRYFTDAVDRICSDEELLTIFQRESSLGVQLATETLRWMRTTFRLLDRNNVHALEKSRLGELSGMPLLQVVKTYRFILDDLSGRYTSAELDTDFYRTAFDEAVGPPPVVALDLDATSRVEILIRDLLAAWDALLSAKILTSQLDALTEARETFTTRITNRVREYRRVQSIFSPFVDYLTRGWDLSRDVWDEADLDILAEYASLLEHEDDIRRLAELLGRFHEAEIQSDEEEITKTVVTKRWINDETEPSEIVGVRESGDLANLLTSEVALAGEPLLGDRFLQKFVDKRLLTFAYSNRRQVTGIEESSEVQTRSQRRTRGPFIICVDTSYSMAGQAELLAKIIAFGILRVAIEEDREAYLINFSVQIKTLDLRDAGREIDKLAEFLRMSFHGGTDVTLALAEGLRKLDEGRYQDADVLVVSDFIMFRLARHVLDDMRSQKHNHGTRFHALTFEDMPSEELMECFDSAWFSDLERPGVIEELATQVRNIRTMQNR